MLLEAPPTPPPPVDPESLIEEARARRRRRRRGIAAVVLVAAAAAVAAFVVRGRPGAPGVERVPNGPVVNLRALAGHGTLAFVSRSELYAASGSHVRRLPLPAGYFVAAQPALSPDGRHLAYLATSPNGVTPSQLWLANGDGTGARRIPGVVPVRLPGWSGDELAVVGPQGLTLVGGDGSVRRLVTSSRLYGAAWSPDGTALAFGLDLPRGPNRIESVPATGGAPTVWRTWRTHPVPGGVTLTTVEVAGWWKRGVGLWLFPGGSVSNNDDTPLDLLARPGAPLRPLGRTLSSGLTDAVAASPSGIAFVTGGWRSAWDHKQLVVCSGTRCRMQPVRGRVSVDPAWSPDGRTLAYADAPEVADGPWSQQRIAAWFAAHRAHLYDAATGKTRALPAANGATALTWSADGKSLLFVKNDALWLLPSLGGRAVRVAAPIYPAGRWPQYYAQVDWVHQFSWSS